MGSKNSVADRTNSLYMPLRSRGHPYIVTIRPKEEYPAIRDTIVDVHFIKRNGKLYLDGLFVSVNRHGRTSHIIEIDQEKNLATTANGNVYRFTRNVCDLPVL
jgi:hypothetical protein